MLRPRLFLCLGLALAALTCASQRPDRPPTRVVAPRGPAQWDHGWVDGAVFYEVFVRSFADSDGDGKGDLEGLISKLDYLNDGNPATDRDLQVDALWLMPVFQSPSYHGYDTVDYERIDDEYGSNATFERFLAEAHRRGIEVIVDFVVNHTSASHPWFLDSASGPSSSRREWYVWSPTNPGWTQPWGPGPTWHAGGGAFYYGVFWSGMPDVNWRHPPMRAEMHRLAKLWLDRGVDGFRLDATRHLVETGPGAGQSDTAETHAVLKELSAFVRSVQPDAILVGENWTDTPTIATYYGDARSVPGGDELPMNFDFPLAEAVVSGVRAGQGAGIAAKLAEIGALYPSGALDAPFLTNHDQVRVATQLGGETSKLRNAAAILLTLPGTPFLYYGEEIGLQNGTTSNDEAKRTPMPWDATAGGGFTAGTPWFPFAPGKETANVAAQTENAGSLLSRYRTLIRARRASPALSRGATRMLSPAGGSPAILAFTRTEGAETVFVAHNLGDAIATAGPYDLPGGSSETVFADPGASLTGSTSAWRVTLPPRASGVFWVRSP